MKLKNTLIKLGAIAFVMFAFIGVVEPAMASSQTNQGAETVSQPVETTAGETGTTDPAQEPRTGSENPETPVGTENPDTPVSSENPDNPVDVPPVDGEPVDTGAENNETTEVSNTSVDAVLANENIVLYALGSTALVSGLGLAGFYLLKKKK